MNTPIPLHLKRRPNRDAWMKYKRAYEQRAVKMGFHSAVVVDDEKSLRSLAYWYGLEHGTTAVMDARMENAFLIGAGLQP